MDRIDIVISRHGHTVSFMRAWAFVQPGGIPGRTYKRVAAVATTIAMIDERIKEAEDNTGTGFGEG